MAELRLVPMSSISFFTPVHFCGRPSFSQKFLETVDNYFYLGGKRARVLQGKTWDNTLAVMIVDHPHAEGDLIATAVKIATYVTLILPLLMLALKAILRSSCHFEISKDPPKNASSESPAEFRFPPLTEEEFCNDPKDLIGPLKMKMIEHKENPGKSLDAVIYKGGWSASCDQYLALLIDKKMIFSYALYKSSDTGEIYIIKLQKEDREPPFFLAHPENICLVYPLPNKTVDPLAMQGQNHQIDLNP